MQTGVGPVCVRQGYSKFLPQFNQSLPCYTVSIEFEFAKSRGGLFAQRNSYEMLAQELGTYSQCILRFTDRFGFCEWRAALGFLEVENGFTN